jgi:transposase
MGKKHWNANSEELEGTGVYYISTPSLNRKIYIGSAAVSFRRRWTVHESELKTRKHHCQKLQEIYNEHGVSVFVFTVAEECSPEECVELEQQFLDSTDFERLYNENPTAGSVLGYKFTDEQLASLIDSHGGISDKTKLKSIVQEYRDGALQSVLAERHGVDRKTIRNILERFQAQIRPLPKHDNILIREIEDEYKNGTAIKTIAERKGLDQGTVRRILENNEVELRNNSNRQLLRFEKRNERKKLSKSHGGKEFLFIHRIHGYFFGFPFEMRVKYPDLKSAGTLSQLCGGKKEAYRGWEIADPERLKKNLPHIWGKPAEREYPRGSGHPMFGRKKTKEEIRKTSEKNTKLADDQLPKILIMLASGITQKEIAQEFKVHQSVISSIKNRRRRFRNLDKLLKKSK